jgi:small subunit ribosomal protein S6
LNQYEAMFVIDPTFGATFEACDQEVRRLMERAEAELLFCRKWDERRLAYKIEGRKRGVYVLTFFRCAGDKIAGLERDVQISEHVLRVLVLRADHMTPDMMEQAATPVAAVQEEGGYDPRKRPFSGDGGRRPRDAGPPRPPRPAPVGAPAGDDEDSGDHGDG